MPTTLPVTPEFPSDFEILPSLSANHPDAASSAAEASAQARGAAALSAAPRIVTTGGNSLPGPPAEKQALAHIDWFAFTIKPQDGCGLSWLFSELVNLFGIREATPTGKGWFGYAERHDLGGSGILAHGGKSQRRSIHVELNATGCARTYDWIKVREWGETHKATITRIDLAHDDMTGQTVSIAIALQWLHAGQFATNGRPPAAQLIDDLESGKGKTLYVGSRTNGKLCRVYEKGRQLGDPSNPWVRVEVELRNKSRVIPWDTLATPGHYLAGSYPCLDFLSETQEKIRTITKTANVSYACAVHHAKQMTGKLVNVMMQFHGGDAFAVVNELKREGVPRRLENFADFLPHIIAGNSE